MPRLSTAWTLVKAMALVTVVLMGSAAAQNAGQSPAPATAPADGIHLGVLACAGSTCHNATQAETSTNVIHNEFHIWKDNNDKHAKAYAVLLTPPAVRIARNLGLATSAENSPECLGCHADNAASRGPLFNIADGVGCEACHGGAGGPSSWLGVHISGAGHKANLAAGMYPTEQASARAEKCLSCHFGNNGDRRFSHRILGAGHPRLVFELQTSTRDEPQHFVLSRNYVERKNPASGMQVWAVGQAKSLAKRMEALVRPQNAPKGMFPELALFDCQACHHSVNQVRWERRSSTGLEPGVVRLNDANAVMLRVIAARVSPAASTSLGQHMLALHKATTEDWGTVQREAAEVRRAAQELAAVLAGHDFTREDMRAMAAGLIQVGISGDDADFAGAEQTAKALSAIVDSELFAGLVSADQAKAMNDARRGIDQTVADDETYRPDAYINALKAFQGVMAH